LPHQPLPSLLAAPGPESSGVAIVVGCGEVGSAVAVALRAAGASVVLVDRVDPAWHRRGMALADAWYVGTAALGDERACFCASPKSIPSVLERGLIAATTWSWAGLAPLLHPWIVLDARGRLPDGQRVVRAARPGRFATERRIGDAVREGEIIGGLGGEGIASPADGVLLGLAARGARIDVGDPLAEVDPDGERSRCFGIRAEAWRIAEDFVATIARGSRSPREFEAATVR